MAKTDTYNKEITMVRPGAIIRVLFPDITDEENARRMKQIHDAAASLLMSRGKDAR